MQVTSSKCLGVYIDEHLTWVEHVSHISKKIAKNISILSRIRHCLHKCTLQGIPATIGVILLVQKSSCFQ